MSRAPLTADVRRYLATIGTTLRDLRREAGLLQEQIAVRTGTVGARVGEIERGEVDTSLSRLRALAIALGLPLSAFFRRVELAADPRAAEAMRDQVREAIRRLGHDDLDLVAAFVRRLLARHA